MTDPHKIAAGLSEAQQRALIDCEWHGSGETAFATIPCLGVSPLPASLAHMLTLRSDRITPLGLAVRAILMKEPNQ
jgi:hypothetical protein